MAQKANNTLIWVIVAVLVLLGVFYFTTRGNEPGTPVVGEDASAIKIGVITPLTGDAAVYGSTISRAYDLAVEEINADGGIHGRNLELVYEDGKCNGTDATTAAQKLINIDQVDVILGGACSGETIPAAELTQAARVLLLSPSATSPDLTDAGDLFFRTYPSDAFEAQLMAAYALDEQGFTRPAVISENTDFAQALRAAFTGQVEGNGGALVFDETFNTGETDFRTLITKMRTANPDVVYLIPQAPAAGELLLKQIREAGLTMQVLAPNSMLDRDTISENATLYEGVVLSEVQLDEESEKTNALLAGLESAYGEASNFPAFSASSYDSVYLIAEAMRSGAMDGEAIAAWLRGNVSDWPGAIGVLNFDANGDAVIELTLVQAKAGIVAPIER